MFQLAGYELNQLALVCYVLIQQTVQLAWFVTAILMSDSCHIAHRDLVLNVPYLLHASLCWNVLVGTDVLLDSRPLEEIFKQQRWLQALQRVEAKERNNSLLRVLNRCFEYGLPPWYELCHFITVGCFELVQSVADLCVSWQASFY